MADKFDDLMPKVLPLLRMLVSGTDGEVVNSITALRLILAKAELDIHAVVERVEMSTVTARQQLYDFGYADGREDEAEEQRRKSVAAAPKPSISPPWMTNSTTMSDPASMAFPGAIFRSTS